MGIKHICSDLMDYKVGDDDVTKIEPTDHGDAKTTIYKVVYEDESLLFVGLLSGHEVEHAPAATEQVDIFEFI